MTFSVGFSPNSTSPECLLQGCWQLFLTFCLRNTPSQLGISNGSLCFSPALRALKSQVLSTAANRRSKQHSITHMPTAEDTGKVPGALQPNPLSKGRVGSANNSLPHSYKVPQTHTVPCIASKSCNRRGESGEWGAAAATQPRWSQTSGGSQRCGTASSFAAQVSEHFPRCFLSCDLLLQDSGMWSVGLPQG